MAHMKTSMYLTGFRMTVSDEKKVEYILSFEGNIVFLIVFQKKKKKKKKKKPLRVSTVSQAEGGGGGGVGVGGGGGWGGKCLLVS